MDARHGGGAGTRDRRARHTSGRRQTRPARRQVCGGRRLQFTQRQTDRHKHKPPDTHASARAHTSNHKDPVLVCTFELTMHYVRTTCRQGRSSSSIQERSPSSCDMPTATAYSEVCIFSNTLATPSDMPTATAMRSAFWR